MFREISECCLMPAHHRPVYTKTYSAAREPSGRDCAFSPVIHTPRRVSCDATRAVLHQRNAITSSIHNSETYIHFSLVVLEYVSYVSIVYAECYTSQILRPAYLFQVVNNVEDFSLREYQGSLCTLKYIYRHTASLIVNATHVCFSLINTCQMQNIASQTR